MPKGQKPTEAADYECIWCDTIFHGDETDKELTCPGCGNKERRDLVPIYMTDTPKEDRFYSAEDFPGG